MLRRTLICTALLGWLGSVCLAQEPKPKLRPLPEGSGGARGEGFGSGPGRPGETRGGKGGPPPERGGGERGKGPFMNNPPFGGRGPQGLPGEGTGFRPGMGPRGELERMRQEDPEMHALLDQDQQLERQTLDMAEQMQRASGEQRDKLKTQLAELVNKHFDVRQQRRELQLKRMEAELGRLREAIKQRNDSRETIIKERLTELTGEAKGLGF